MIQTIFIQFHTLHTINYCTIIQKFTYIQNNIIMHITQPTQIKTITTLGIINYNIFAFLGIKHNQIISKFLQPTIINNIIIQIKKIKQPISIPTFAYNFTKIDVVRYTSTALQSLIQMSTLKITHIYQTSKKETTMIIWLMINFHEIHTITHFPPIPYGKMFTISKN